MGIRKVKDAVDLETNEVIYFKGHAQATYMSDGRNMEDAINDIKTGMVTGVKVNGSTKSPSSGTVDIGSVVTSVKINGSTKSPSSGVVDLGTVITSHQDISGKMDKIPVQNHGTSSTTLSIAPNVLHKWGTVSKLAITLTAPTDTSVYNEYMIQFSSGSTPTTLSVPSTVKWMVEPKIEANKTYQISIVDNIGIIVGV